MNKISSDMVAGSIQGISARKSARKNPLLNQSFRQRYPFPVRLPSTNTYVRCERPSCSVCGLNLVRRQLLRQRLGAELAAVRSDGPNPQCRHYFVTLRLPANHDVVTLRLPANHDVME